MSRQEIFSCKSLFNVFILVLSKLLIFLLFYVVLLSVVFFEYCYSFVGIFLTYSRYIVGDACSSIYYTCLLLCLFWVCWVRENFSGGPGHIFSVWDSAVWSAGPVQFYLGTILNWMAGLYRFFFFSGSVVAGTVRLKW